MRCTLTLFTRKMQDGKYLDGSLNPRYIYSSFEVQGQLFSGVKNKTSEQENSGCIRAYDKKRVMAQ